MTALEDEEKEMEVVELIVHTEEELEMKQEQVEKAKKRWHATQISRLHCNKVDNREIRWRLLRTVLSAISAMSLVGHYQQI